MEGVPDLMQWQDADSHRIRADRVMWKADADAHDVSGAPGVFLELVGIHNLAHVDVTV